MSIHPISLWRSGKNQLILHLMQLDCSVKIRIQNGKKKKKIFFFSFQFFLDARRQWTHCRLCQDIVSNPTLKSLCLLWSCSPGAPVLIPRLLMQDVNADALRLITYILNRNSAEQTIGCAIRGVQPRSMQSSAAIEQRESTTWCHWSSEQTEGQQKNHCSFVTFTEGQNDLAAGQQVL